MLRRDWTREELIVVFNLYCKIPFGKIHIRNPLIKELARVLGRTPSAVSWKLANFARLDTPLQKRNIRGASHGSQREIEVWREFNNNWDALAFESEHLLKKMSPSSSPLVEQTWSFPEGKTRESLVRVRVNQGFFRQAVLSAYGSKCCITGLSIPQLLNASHIVPWAVDTRNRTNPRNGLCLNVIHDRAFDCGLITVTPNLRVAVSEKIRANSADKAAHTFVSRYANTTISLPRRFQPDPDFLRYHNENVFLRS